MRYVDADFHAMKRAKDAVQTWLRGQLKTFFSDGIRRLVDRSNKCVDKLGDYVEK
jgi:hypothetical protein